MTDAGQPDPAAPDGDAAPDDAPRQAPPSSPFTLQGRVAPGLYLAGWLGSGLGLGLLVVAVLGGPTGPVGLVLVLAALVLLVVGLISAAGAQGIQRRAEGRVGFGGPSPFLVLAACLPVTVLGVVLLLGPAGAAGLDVRSPLASLLSLLITAAVYIALIRLLVVDPGALSWAQMGLRRVHPGAALADLGLGASMALPVVVVTGLVAGVLVPLLGTTPPSPLPVTGTTPGLILNFLSAAIVAPIGEEVFFRGFATTAWLRSLGPRSAILRGAAFFALVHVLTIGAPTFAEAAPQALIGFVARIPVGLALGWIFVRRGSLYASIGLHAAFNGLLMVLAEAARAG